MGDGGNVAGNGFRRDGEHRENLEEQVSHPLSASSSFALESSEHSHEWHMQDKRANARLFLCFHVRPSDEPQCEDIAKRHFCGWPTIAI